MTICVILKFYAFDRLRRARYMEIHDKGTKKIETCMPLDNHEQATVKFLGSTVRQAGR
jgi:hypothetical protein